VSWIRNFYQDGTVSNELFYLFFCRLISALFSNPYLNLAPKPYLSYLVSTLLSSIILERRDKSAPPVLDHVDLAAGVLSQTLRRWATPVNQLR
jgi:hypothetical protein